MELRTPALEKFFQKQWGKSRSKKKSPAGKFCRGLRKNEEITSFL
jgi:hypothetical protein